MDRRAATPRCCFAAAFPALRRLPAFGAAVFSVALLLGGSGLALAEPPKEAARGATLAPAARQLVDWVVRSGDHHGLAFLVVDKPNAMLHIVDADGRLRGSSPVLLGVAPGDHSVPGIGDRTLAEMAPHERTTPAGRFVAERGRNAKGVDVIWIDYDSGLSMHRVIDTVPEERRPQRLASPTIADNRISYGCVNVPVGFYETSVRPMFEHYRAVVYILPEQRSLQQVFGIDGPRVARSSEPAPR